MNAHYRVGYGIGSVQCKHNSAFIITLAARLDGWCKFKHKTKFNVVCWWDGNQAWSSQQAEQDGEEGLLRGWTWSEQILLNCHVFVFVLLQHLNIPSWDQSRIILSYLILSCMLALPWPNHIGIIHGGSGTCVVRYGVTFTFFGNTDTYFWDVVWQNAAGRRSGVGGSLHGPCLWRAMNPCWSARWELKLLCCYATSMLVLLAIVWACSDCRYPQMCYKAKLSEYTRQVTLHCGLSHDLCTSLCDWPPQCIYIYKGNLQLSPRICTTLWRTTLCLKIYMHSWWQAVSRHLQWLSHIFILTLYTLNHLQTFATCDSTDQWSVWTHHRPVRRRAPAPCTEDAG